MINKQEELLYQSVTFPQASAIAWFHPKTAHGKLNAVIMPIIPNGFHCSIRMCPGPEESRCGRRED